MNGAATRILLARRASGCDHAVAFEPAALRIEGGFALRRHVAYRSVWGVERRGAWLWLGSGLVPVAVGGRDVPAERLDAVASALATRLARLPDGPQRLARLATRRPSRPRVPWLGLALAVAGTAAVLAREGGWLTGVTDALLLAAVALGVERWLGAAPLALSGALGCLAAALVGLDAVPASPAAFGLRALGAAWLGFAAYVRVRREPELSVLARSSLDATLALALAFSAQALATHTHLLPLAAAALAGCASAALCLRRSG